MDLRSFPLTLYPRRKFLDGLLNCLVVLQLTLGTTPLLESYAHHNTTMAETKKDAPAAAPAAGEEKKGRPTMPDEAEYQKKLKAAEAEHKKAMDKLVRHPRRQSSSWNHVHPC